MRTKIIFALIAYLFGMGLADAQVPRQTFDVTVGDVVVKLTPNRFRRVREYPSVSLSPEIDDRFRFSHSLRGVAIVVAQGKNAAQSYDEVAQNSPPMPDLFQVPATMSVFEYRGASALIRVNGADFLGKQLYVRCNLRQLAPTRPTHQCQVWTQLTDRVHVLVSFFDGSYPASEWVRLMASIEAGLKEALAY